MATRSQELACKPVGGPRKFDPDKTLATALLFFFDARL